MKKKQKVETLNSSELINEVANTSSNQTTNKTTNEMSQGTSIVTVKAKINGEIVVITPAYTMYNMQQKTSENLLKISNPKQRLSVKFHFATPETFWQEGITLFDYQGNLIEPNTASVYVVCDTADSYWRVHLDPVLEDVEIHTFSTVQEYAQVIGNTMLYSRGLNNVEKIGYAALATGDEATMAIYNFAKSNNVPISVAQLYLDVSLTAKTVQTMLVGRKPELVPSLGRSEADAQTLYEQMTRTFTKGSAKKRYAITVVNDLMKNQGYDMSSIMDCLQEIPAHQVAMAELERCDSKTACIAAVLITWLMKRQRPVEKDAA